MTAARVIPPVLDPELAESETVRRAQADLDALMAYADARTRAKPVTTISTEATPSVIGIDRTLRLAMAEIRQRRLDALDAILADAEPVTDWEAIAEVRRGH